MSKKRRNRRGKEASLAVNIAVKLAAILVTIMLMLLMVFNVPIISYQASSTSDVQQMSITKYFKSKTPVKYIEGEISRMDTEQINMKEDADLNNDGLDLNQTIEGQFTILFLGFDTPTNGSGNLHDVNYLIQFNLRTASMNILQIPRDTYVPAYTTASTNKFNSVYACGDPEVSNIQRVVNCVQESFDIPVDAYVTTTCDNVVEIIDIVGGVPIDMPYSVVFEADKILYEGQQTLTGEQSEWFLRFRYGYEYGDIGRVQAQRYFLAAAMKKAISMGTFQMFNAINEIYDKELIGTDMSVEDLSRLADLAGTVGMDNVHIFMLPGESAMADGQSIWSVHKSAAIDILNEYFRTQQYPLTPEHSAIVEWVPEGSYLSTAYDDTAASFQEIDDGQADGPALSNKYSNTYQTGNR